MIGVLVVNDVSLIVLWGGFRFLGGMRRFPGEFISRSTRINAPTAGCVIGPRFVLSMPFTNLQSLGLGRFVRS
jgi:hypothetical protein